MILPTTLPTNSRVGGWAWSDGTVYSKTYDDVGRLKVFPLADTTRTILYDELENITGWNDSGKAEYKRFSYDELNRLTRFNERQPAVGLDDDGNEVAITNVLQRQLFEYDANGNRLLLTDGTAETEVKTIYDILDESNRLSSVGETTYQYDENGNIINDGEHDYRYDARNRLTQVDSDHQYFYNASNMRVKKTNNGNTTLYGWDNDRIYAEYDASGIAIQETVYFGSTPIALLKDNSVYRIFADQIDTPRVIANQDNDALWSWESKPFGETLPNEDVDNDGLSLSYNLRFPGQYYDQETKKHYNFNRDYNPATGRYIQSDPIGLGGGDNTFRYADNTPLNRMDSLGTYVQVIVTGRTNVEIKVPITYTGAVGNTARGMNLNIQRLWSGTIGIYNVNTTVTAGSGNIINVINERYDDWHTGPVSHVLGVGGNRGTWNLFDLAKDANWGWTAAHEAGHLMGLNDRYHPVTALVYPHGKGHIMGEQNAEGTEQADIWNIIEFAKRSKTYVQK